MLPLLLVRRTSRGHHMRTNGRTAVGGAMTTKDRCVQISERGSMAEKGGRMMNHLDERPGPIMDLSGVKRACNFPLFFSLLYFMQHVCLTCESFVSHAPWSRHCLCVYVVPIPEHDHRVM